MRRKRIWTVGVSMMLLLTATTPALADESSAPESFEELALQSAPEILAETDTTVAPTISVESGDVTVVPTDEVPLVPEGGNLIAPPELIIDFAEAADAPAADGVVEIETNDANSAAFMQPIENGYRIVTSTADSSGPSSFSYTLDVPTDAYLEAIEEHLFVVSGDETHGVLGKAWAKDGWGNSVPTWYTLEDRVLTQHLDLSEVEKFPVLADPGWSYSLEYTTNKSAYAVANLLGSCFNCYFPVEGAPRAFPTVGQLLPLRVGLLNFESTFATVSANPQYTWFQYSFYATHNHYDGPGSAISFTFHSQKLYVYAWITNYMGVQLKSTYLAGAVLNWNNFANNLRNA